MFKKSLWMIFLAGVPFLTMGNALSAEPDAASTQTSAPPSSGAGGVETVRKAREALLAAGDHLVVKIFPEDQYIKGGEMVVSSEGDITLALVGKVKVEGMKAVDAEREIVNLLAKDYLVNPVVVIEVTRDVAKKQARSLSILGQVQKPGTYQLPENEKLTLLQLISMAGGFTEVANVKKIKVIRKEGGKVEVIRANAETIISGSQPDIELKEQDVVHVGESLF